MNPAENPAPKKRRNEGSIGKGANSFYVVFTESLYFYARVFTMLRGLSLATTLLGAAASSHSVLLRGAMDSELRASGDDVTKAHEATAWPVTAKCKSWCKNSFGDKDPVQVCAYMKTNNLPCTGCDPCVANSAAKPATQPAAQCKSWCKKSFGGKDPVQVCAYMKTNNLPCTGCDPCVANSAAKPATQPAAQCESWCKNSFENKDPVTVCAYKKCTGCDPCGANAAKPKAEANAEEANAAKPKAEANTAEETDEKADPETEVEQLAKDEKIIKAAADAGMTPLEYAQKVAHLNPKIQSMVAQAAAKHAKDTEQKNKAKAAHINQVKAMADAMQKKINISKEKAVMVAMLGAQEKLKANCRKNGHCVKKGTGELSDEEAMSSYGTPLGVKKVISTECVMCPEADSGGCVMDMTNYETYVAYLKCKENAKQAN